MSDFKAKMRQIQFPLRLRPDTAGGLTSYSIDAWTYFNFCPIYVNTLYTHQCLLLKRVTGTRAAVHAEVARLEEKLANLTDKNSKLEDELSTLENCKYCSRL